MSSRKLFPRCMITLLCAALLLGAAPLTVMAGTNDADSAIIDISDIGEMDAYTGSCWDYDDVSRVFTIKSDVTVEGYNDGLPHLIFSIKDNSTVTWAAYGYGESSGDYDFALVDLRGSGTFVVDDGSFIGIEYGSSALKAEGGVEVIVRGFVYSNDYNYDPIGSIGIVTAGNVFVSGNGTVYAVSPISCTAIYTAGDISISGGSVYASSPEDVLAIHAAGDVAIYGGTIRAAGSAGSMGIYAGGDVLIKDGSVGASGDAGCIAIESDSNLTVDGGSVAVSGDTGCTAIWAGGDVTFNGGLAQAYTGVAIRSVSEINIILGGDCDIIGRGAIEANEASVTVCGNSSVVAQGLLTFDGEEFLGNAIMAKNVTVGDNAQVAALNGAAIFYSGECSITGGAAFAYGDGIGGAQFKISGDDITAAMDNGEDPVVYNMLNVLFKTPDMDIKADVEYTDGSNVAACVSGDGTIVQWDYANYYDAVVAGQSAVNYTTGDKTDIFAYPYGNVDYYWSVTGVFSISYDNGLTSGAFSVNISSLPIKPLQLNPKTDNAIPDNNTNPGNSSGGNSAPNNPGGSFSGGSSSGGSSSGAYTKGSAAGAVYTVQKDFQLFGGVKVGGGALVRDRDYKAESGSTKITLLPSYLDTLPPGTYTLTVDFKDNTSVEARFTIAAGPKLPFTDVAATAWYYNAVSNVYESGLMTGTAADKFEPGAYLSRAMIVTIMYRNAGAPGVSGLSDPFSDVPGNAWYTDAIKWAAAKGIVSGYGNGKFGPDDPVTKEQLATLIYRTEQSSGKTPPNISTGKSFPDSDKISGWAKEAVNATNNQGVFRDIPGSGLNPQNPATRAEAASILYRWLTSAI